ncbi:post-GPI attachment to proteins factor 6 isoform X1 [Scleropages formosus]|uniref:Post-glycosylphosphatidylinositol attachment to proteins 6 n=1 Tax=Scleropages formosus TaxID=113540 RepID=A0A8C9V2G2_SCLFO|nr:post-GPI attachment to proteins factor 6 isoform X1 [Scleropages formosus]
MGRVFVVGYAYGWHSGYSFCLYEDLTYLSNFYCKTPQKLSMYSWYGSVRLYHFRVPEDSVLVCWHLTVTRGSGSSCGNHNISIYIRSGAPPVINPIDTAFPNETAFLLAYNLTASISSGQNTTIFNVSNPEPGDWFIAAHLPKDNGKIEQKGFSSMCSYFFQPQMFVRRVIDMPILESKAPLLQTVSSPEKPAFLKFFVPDYSTHLIFHVWGCSTEGVEGADCPLIITVGSTSLQPFSVRTVNCTGMTSCAVRLLTPPWETWIRITVESIYVNLTTTFSVSANLTVGCKPKSVGLIGDFLAKLNTNSNCVSGANNSAVVGNTTMSGNTSLMLEPFGNECLRTYSVFKEELDVVSVQFSVIGGPNLIVLTQAPTLIPLDLTSFADTGGTLNLHLKLNQTNMTNGNVSVVACLAAKSPFLALNTTQSCRTAFSQGYSLNLNVTSPKAALRLPFPEAAMWYLTLQVLCPDNASDCANVSSTVMTSVYLSACIDECGTYGECRLLRSYSYLYASCVCKAGWSGWGCTDGSTAQTYARQLVAALLLTLSNLSFIPPIIVALHRCYFAEASVYLFTMFFSTFYHACDQPGVTVMCIMDYDTLQYCDFLGSLTSIWVTILCMSRFKDIYKYTLFMLGALIIAMSMQLDRRGMWNMLGPILFALLVMVLAWVYRGVKRRQCYPTTWKRWVFFLIPGIAIAIIGLCVYVFTETDENYFYTHSIWHIMVASSVVFLLPPREYQKEPWGCSRKFCGYQICKNEKEELYTVT